ncbi:aminopeptidase N [Mycolicibacterium sp. P1-5]|nr:aminopeptidase N [Mycolicibacterium sp. P1-5]
METSDLFSQPVERVEVQYTDEAGPVANPVFSDLSTSHNPS